MPIVPVRPGTGTVSMRSGFLSLVSLWTMLAAWPSRPCRFSPACG
jgi:hypothetical protein